jgi:hypothetical protein
MVPFVPDFFQVVGGNRVGLAEVYYSVATGLCKVGFK